MTEPIRWSAEALEGYLDEVQVRGTLTLVCETPSEASSLRWALYGRKGGLKVVITTKGEEVTLTIPKVPQVYVKD